MASLGAEVTVATWDWLAGDLPRIPAEEVDGALDACGVSYTRLPAAPLPFDLIPIPVPTAAGRRKLRTIFQATDAVYFNNAYLLQDLVCASSRRHARPLIISAHHSVLDQGRLAHDTAARVSARTVWHRFNAFHTLNGQDAGYLRSLGHTAVYTLPIPVDPGVYRPGPGRGDHDCCHMVFVGRLNAQKGVDALAEAVSLLYDKDPRLPLRLTIAGDGPLRSTVVRLAETVPWVSHAVPTEADKIRLYQDADILIMPSRRESFGIVAAEAMLCGLPLLSTRNPGATECLDEGVTGFLLSDLTPSGIASRMRAVLELWARNPDLLREMGRRARGIAETRFGSESVWPLYVRMLRDLGLGG